jgi:hypothetical protein
MKNTIFMLTLLMVISSKGFSQNFIYSNSKTTLILDSDFLSADVYDDLKLEIINTTSTVISGAFEAGSITLIPLPDTTIKIIPNDVLGRILTGDGTTVLKPRPPCSGCHPQSLVILYPNPVQNDLTFTTSGRLVLSYSIYDLSGILRASQTISPTNSSTINVSNLTSGTYILWLNLGNNQQITIQFIKN